MVELQPGVVVDTHTHPGEEATVLLDGTLLLEVAGKPAATIRAGPGFHGPHVRTVSLRPRHFFAKANATIASEAARALDQASAFPYNASSRAHAFSACGSL